MRNLKFTDATPEQFKEFWEGEGWEVSWVGTTPIATKMTVGPGSEREMSVRRTGEACLLLAEQVAILHNDGAEPTFEDAEVSLEVWETFGEAADALNELANTRIMGGWAE